MPGRRAAPTDPANYEPLSFHQDGLREEHLHLAEEEVAAPLEQPLKHIYHAT